MRMSGMDIYYTDRFVLPLPEGHQFPMRKYALLRQRVCDAGLVPVDHLQVPAATDAQLMRAHDPEYLRRVQAGGLSDLEVRRIGFPWSAAMVERSRRSAGATIASCRAALRDGWGVNLAGGTHHAFRDRGEGYCVFNDSIVAARATQAEGRARRVLIIDCDVHQGNGTAALAAGDPTIYTFSIHSARNYPLRKEASDLDVGLEDGADDNTYLDALEVGLRRAIAGAKADLAIYLAGADPFFGDRLVRLGLTKFGLAERDRLVFDFCAVAGLPVAVTMAGGYAPDPGDVADIHLATVRQAAARAG
jgi:acetoin utilization deacetylase AcuC-like enzyme